MPLGLIFANSKVYLYVANHKLEFSLTFHVTDRVLTPSPKIQQESNTPIFDEKRRAYFTSHCSSNGKVTRCKVCTNLNCRTKKLKALVTKEDLERWRSELPKKKGIAKA